MKIPRIPLSHFNISQEKDADVENAYNWFRTFLSENDWIKRKNAIEDYLSQIFICGDPFSKPISDGTLLVIKKDQIAWYLYLVHTFLYERHKYEYFQGARVIPIFKRIGMNINLITKIDGVNKKVRDLFRKRPNEADATLFELLTGLLWIRNGWDVKILPEGNGGKSPDFIVKKGNESWQVECKRQMKTSDYTYKETEKRQIMISHVSKLLLTYNVLLDIKFHVELHTLPDEYLSDLLTELIPNVQNPGKIISNTILDIELSYVDIASIKKHLQNYYVKNNSPQLHELITKKQIDYSAFTAGFLAGYYYVGDGEANNLYVCDIENAYGVHCYCDSEKAIDAKARDIKIQLFSAIKQFNSENNSIVHIGMETFDGPAVEKARTEKIFNTMANIDPAESKLRWIFYHYFQSYTRSYEDWYFDETVSLGSAYYDRTPPIKEHFLIIPEDIIKVQEESHWNLDLP